MSKLLILGATYGKANVTNKVRAMVANETLTVTAAYGVFGDNWPGTQKTFVLVYRYADQAPRTLVLTEGQSSTIAYAGGPEPWQPAEGALNVLGAAYGRADVRAAMAGRVKDNRLSVPADNATWGDGWPGVVKTLVAVTSYGFAAPVTTIVTEGQTLGVAPRVPDARGPMLRVNETLARVQYLVSPSGLFYAHQQMDGHFCVYRGAGPADNKGGVWFSGAHGAMGEYFLIMQSDGNLCTYKGTPTENRGYFWGTQALAPGGKFFLYLHDDGNLCVYKGTDMLDNQGILWQTGIHESAAGKPAAAAHRWLFAGDDSWTAPDSAGDTDGALRNAVRDPKGPYSEHAVRIDGTDTSYVSFGKDVGTFRRESFTLAFWFNTRETIRAFDLIGNRTAPSHGNFFCVRMTGNHESEPAGQVTVEVDQDGNGTNYAMVRSAATGLNDGRWHHVTVTREGARLSLYVDGALSGSSAAAGVADVNNGNDFRIGRSLQWNVARFAPVASFADVRLYNAVVKPAQGLSLADLRAVIAAHAPVLRFHPDEKYLPSSVEWYLARADLAKADGTRVQATPDNLPVTGTDDRSYQLVLRDEASRAGDLSTAVAYVRAKPASTPGFTDVSSGSSTRTTGPARRTSSPAWATRASRPSGSTTPTGRPSRCASTTRRSSPPASISRSTAAASGSRTSAASRR